QDAGRLTGTIRADQGLSFQAMTGVLSELSHAVGEDPATENVVAFTGGNRGTSNNGTMFVALKPKDERGSIDDVIGRMRGRLAKIPGVSLFLQPVQDLRIGGMV